MIHKITIIYKISSPSSKYIFIGVWRRGKKNLINHVKAVHSSGKYNSEHCGNKYKYKICKYDDYKIKYIKIYDTNLTDIDAFNKEKKYRKKYHAKKNNVVTSYYHNKDSKKYYEKNNDAIKERQRRYYQKNKDKINTPYNCECGSILSRKSDRKKHELTDKHISYIKYIKRAG
jgi:hypothetical protein